MCKLQASWSSQIDFKKHICLLFSCSVVSDSATPRTVTHQAPLSMGFSRQEYWSGVPFPSPGDLPDPGIKPKFPPQTGGFFTTGSPGKPMCRHEHSTAQNFIPELLRLNCWPMWDTSWSDTNLPLPLLFRLQSCFVSLFTLIHDNSGREPACQCRRHNRCGLDIWVGKIPWRRAWQPAPVFLPGESHEQRSLVGHRPWGCKELDMTEAA